MTREDYLQHKLEALQDVLIKIHKNEDLTKEDSIALYEALKDGQRKI